MAMAKLFALDTNRKQYYILRHFIRKEYITRMWIEMMNRLSSHIKTSKLNVLHLHLSVN